MEIKIAEHSGFCYGAKRIVQLAESNGRAYSLGPVLHNEQLVEKLREKGIEPLSLDEILKRVPGKVIIRAHGVPENEITVLKKAGFEIIDGTCPNVAQVYCVSRDYEQKGYKIFIFGDKDHAEVIGIISRLKSPTAVLKPEDIPGRHYDKICLVSQTTQIPSAYEEIKKALAARCNKLKAVDTICSATRERQDAASSLAKEADVMLVIGGKQSSNTRKLYSICSRYNSRVYLIQTKEDLDRKWFSDSFLVGITAGASTPGFVIESVVSELKKY
jgi:4-hydroxy-3-methylbut-2-enyl diphosphate reductase